MKKKLLILCVLVVLVMGLAVSAHADGGIHITTTAGEACPGGTITLSFAASNIPATGVSSIGFTVSLPEGVTVVSGAATADGRTAFGSSNGFNVAKATFNFVVGVDDDGNPSLFTANDVTLGTVTCKVADSVKPGTKLSVDVTSIKSQDHEAMPLSGHTSTPDDIDVGSHKLVHNEAVAADCAHTGIKENWKCSVCKNTYLDAAGTEKVEGEDENAIQNALKTPVDSTKHAYGEGQVTTPGSCTTKAQLTQTCANDASHKNTIEGDYDYTKHNYDDGVVTYPEGEFECTADGTKTYTCKDCAEGTQGHTKTETVAKVDHTWDEGQVVKEATETEKGTKLYTCTVCGETKTEDIPALGSDKTDDTSKGNGTAPKTGDESNIALWVVLFVVCAAVVTVVATKKLRKN